MKKRKVKIKNVKHFTGIVLVLLLGVCLYACLKPVGVDVVMIGMVN